MVAGWLAICGIWLFLTAAPSRNMDWQTVEWGLGGNSPAGYGMTAVAISLPTALLLSGRYLHGLRDGVLLLLLLGIFGLGVYLHRLNATPLTVLHAGAILTAFVAAETLARLLGMWLDAPEIRLARGGYPMDGRGRLSERKSRSRNGRSKSNG
jgi:hypothetical protein